MKADVLEASRRLAEGLSSTLTDSEKETAQSQALEVMTGLRTFCADSESSEEVAVRLAHVIARMLGEMQTVAISTLNEMLEANMVAYGLAAGAMAGVYKLPGDEGFVPKAAQDEAEAEVFHIGQYL